MRMIVLHLSNLWMLLKPPGSEMWHKLGRKIVLALVVNGRELYWIIALPAGLE
jgi:hypothetical protein